MLNAWLWRDGVGGGLADGVIFRVWRDGVGGGLADGVIFRVCRDMLKMALWRGVGSC